MRLRRRFPVIRSMVVMVALATLLALSVPSPALALNPQPEPPMPVYLDGDPFDFTVAPENAGEDWLVPGGPFLEGLGATVLWDPYTQSMTASRGTTNLKFQVGVKAAVKNGTAVPLPVAPKMFSSTMMIPMRVAAEALGAKVTLDATKGALYVSQKPALLTLLTPLIEPIYRTVPVVKATGLLPSARLKLITQAPSTVPGARPLVSADTEMDQFMVDGNAAQAASPPVAIKSVVLPKLDYSPHVTFIQDQDSWSGTLLRAATQAVTILKEMESPYSPDLSEWFLEHQYDDLFWPWAKTHPNAPPEYIPKFETDILQNEGLCTEVSLPSNYDKAVKTLVKDPYGNPVHDFNGNPIHYWDTTLMPQPATATMQEALMYRVTAFSDPLSTASLGVDGLKGLLQTYGPLVAGGPLPILLGSSGNPWDSNPDSPYGLGHESYYSMKRGCVTVVGYDDLVKNKDDSLGAFKCLGSWGDRVLIGGSNLPGGYFYVPYSSLTGQLTWARYFLNKASDRVGSSQAYTARIGVNCKFIRGGLRIKVGVVGKTPLTVWDRPNISSCRDSSHNLAIDVPLPAYAATAWPPGSARWYLEVEDLLGQDVQVTEFTLAKWSLNQHNLSVGRYAAKTYKPDAGQLPASKGTSGNKITVYIPTTTNPFPVLSVFDPSEKTLAVDQGSFADGTKEITITGSLKKTVVTGGGLGPSGAPLPSYTTLVGIPGAEVRLYELDQTACVNLPAQWKLAMKGTTAPTGTFAFKLTPGAGRHVYGVAYTGGGEDVQLSSQCIIVGTPLSGQPPRLYLDLPSLDTLPQLNPGPGQWYLPGLAP